MSSPSTYGWSALFAGVRYLLRAALVVAPVIVINALVQAALILPDEQGITPLSVVLAIASFIVIVLAFTLSSQALLNVVRGGRASTDLVAGSRPRLLPVALWMLGLIVVVAAGVIAYVIPGLIILALTPFLLIAVADKAPNPLRANFVVIRKRLGRWIVTVLVMGVICFLLWLGSALSTFFVTGFVSAVITWLAYGLIAGWFLAAWTAIWVSVTDGAVQKR